MVSHTFKFMLTQSNIQGISKKEMALKICPFSQNKKKLFQLFQIIHAYDKQKVKPFNNPIISFFSFSGLIYYH